MVLCFCVSINPDILDVIAKRYINVASTICPCADTWRKCIPVKIRIMRMTYRTAFISGIFT